MLQEFKVATVDSVLDSGLHIRSFNLIRASLISGFFKNINEDEHLRKRIQNVAFTDIEKYIITSIRHPMSCMSQEEKNRCFYVVCDQKVEPEDSFKALCDLSTLKAILKPCCIMYKELYLGNMSILLIETAKAK